MRNLPGRIVSRFFGRFQHRVRIANTRRLAEVWNQVRDRGEIQEVADGYRSRYEQIFKVNGPDCSGTPRNRLQDGWAIDPVRFPPSTPRSPKRIA